MDEESSSDHASSDTASLARAVRQSQLGNLWHAAGRAVRSSFLYRWLTAEPDPDVIVIDLRETWTVGPVIRLLDAVIDRAWPALDDSRVASGVRAGVRLTLGAPAVVCGLAILAIGLGLGLTSVTAGTLGTTRLGVTAALVVAGIVATRERRSWSELRETRPVELLVAALEPPEPPDRETREKAGDVGTDTQADADSARDGDEAGADDDDAAWDLEDAVWNRDDEPDS